MIAALLSDENRWVNAQRIEVSRRVGALMFRIHLARSLELADWICSLKMLKEHVRKVGWLEVVASGVAEGNKG